MNDPVLLTQIATRVTDDDHLVVPHGLTPVYLHDLDGRKIVYVTSWTAEKENDQNLFDLYPLRNARSFVVSLKVNGDEVSQKWYDNFGEPKKEAVAFNGELKILTVH